jgi:hypothetical protein
MTFIGVDLGFNDATTVVIVRSDSQEKWFTFSSVERGTEFEEVAQRVIGLMIRYRVRPKDLYSPGNPAFERRVKDFFMRNPDL